MYTGIVHTMTFSMQITQSEIDNILLYHISDYANNYTFSILGRGFKITINKKSKWLFLFIDAIEFLNSPTITESSVDVINKKIDLIFDTLDIKVSNFNLTRFDFRIDITMSQEDRTLYFKLIEKIQSKKNWLYRVNFEKYKESSAYFNSRSKKTSSIKLNIYDKERERNNKGFTPTEYERNLVRFEIQLNNSHLRYHNRKSGISRTIEEYLHTNIIHQYFQKYLQPIFFKGHYFDVYHASKIINKNIAKLSLREDLREFLIFISRNNIDAAREHYSEYKFRKYSKELMNIGINPILIPKNLNRKYMENPLNQFFEKI